MGKRYGIFGIFCILLISFDQWTKYMAYSFLRTGGPFVIADGIFELHYSENTGAAFGILEGRQIIFLVIAAVVTAAVLFYLRKIPSGKRYYPLYFSLLLLTSGAVGNVIDRITRGFVVDFFYFKLIDYPIFNVADCYVVVAAILLLVLVAFVYKDDELPPFFEKEKSDDR